MIKIDEPNSHIKSKDSFYNLPIFDLLFRSSFILASIGSVISLAMWLNYLFYGNRIGLQGLSPALWHAHEMLFTFAATVAVGFLLTAVQTWTGKPSVKGKSVVFLILLWLIAHSLFWLNDKTFLYIALAVKTIWWLYVIYRFATLVLSVKNTRNYLFVPILCVMALLNISVVTAELNDSTSLAIHLCRSMVLFFTLIMTLIGGRVIPFFTANGAKTTVNPPNKVIELGAIILTILSIVIFMFSVSTESSVLWLVYLLTGIFHLARFSHWKFFKTFAVPLLWSLHLAYLFMCFGFIAFGLHYSGYFDSLTLSLTLHVFTLGGIGLMILTMMARVSLGHTGRFLKVKPSIVIAFMLLILAVFARTVLPLFSFVQLGLTASALLWIIAFSLFLFVYIRILIKPRQQTHRPS